MGKFDTKEIFIEKARRVHGDKYDYSQVDYVHSKVKVKIYCKYCNTYFWQLPSLHLTGRGCNNCRYIRVGLNSRKTTEEFIQQAKDIHGNKYDYSDTIYETKSKKVKIYCPICKDYFYQLPSNHLKGQGCPRCGKEKLKKSMTYTVKDFITLAKQIHGNKYNYDEVKNVKYRDKIKIYCNTCKKYFYQDPSLHLKKHGCPICGNKNKSIKQAKGIELFIQQAKKVHEDIYDYTESKYVNADTKIKIRCKKCNKYFYQTPSAHLNNQGCPYCKESKGEKYISKILTTKNIAFNAQYKFNDCKYKKPLVFDFYIPNYNLCIEFNGEQHYKPIKKFGGEETFKVRQKRDQIKREYCAKNNIALLEIKYNDNIEEKLQEYFKW